MFGMVWWGIYGITAIWLQALFPGLDFLAPGLVVSLQEGRWWPGGALLFACVILLQEGMGNLPFGYAPAWYGGLALAFHLGRRLFDPRSVTLMVLLGLFLGGFHFLLINTLMHLEGMSVQTGRVLGEAGAQALAFPLLWLVVHKLFPERLKEDDRTV
ncbi:MAG: hypothetical protein V3573_04270 [Desulfovibrionaceae bacterium]